MWLSEVSPRDPGHRSGVGMTRAFPVCASEAKLLGRAAADNIHVERDTCLTLRFRSQLQSPPWTTLRMTPTIQREMIHGHPRRSTIRRASASLPLATSPPLRSRRKLRPTDRTRKTMAIWAIRAHKTGQTQHLRMAILLGTHHKTQGKRARQPSSNNTARRKDNRDTTSLSATTGAANNGRSLSISFRRR